MIHCDPIPPGWEGLVNTLGLLRAARRKGLDLGPILQGTGLTPDSLEHGHPNLTDERATQLWERIARASDDPLIRLRAVEEVPFGGYPILDFLAASCATLGEAVHHVARYISLVQPTLRMAVARREDGWALVSYAQTLTNTDFALAMTQVHLGLARGEATLPLRARLRRPQEGDRALLRRLFGPRIEHGCDHDELVYSDAQWALPIPSSNPALQRLLDQHAQTLAQRQPKAWTLQDQVAVQLERALPQGDHSLERISAKLGATPRTLQRQLKAEGTSFQEVLDHTRQTLAQEHLKGSKVSVLELAFLLGYNDESAFVRAFRRWTGTSPGAWRARVVA
jgi:AraC-like DNA-binding protein